jgi:pyruvate formate lyase activating enzyme
MECRFCQNWEISQFRPEQVESRSVPPAAMARLARERKDALIAATYTEPVVFAEYVRDCADAAREAGVGAVMISNGWIQEKPLRELLPRLTAVKVDLKAFTETFYDELCSATLAPVLRTLEVLRESGTWFEIVVLVIPTRNDAEEENRRMFRWIREKLGPEVPVHLTRFSPEHAYKLRDLPPTPVRTLERLHAIAREEGLAFVYVGNVRGHPSESTICPGCGEVVVRRYGYRVLRVDLHDGACAHCERPVPGVWTLPEPR